MKIYTKKGDGGKTSLLNGDKVLKSSQKIVAIGAVDELNSLLGVLIAKNTAKEVVKPLTRIQGELFILGSDLMTPKGSGIKVKRISKGSINKLEKEIDIFSKNLPKLINFILPGGSENAALFQFVRTVARRAEREVVKLSDEEKISPNVLCYLNRLSDWLFVVGRFVNKLDGGKETVWKK